MYREGQGVTQSMGQAVRLVKTVLNDDGKLMERDLASSKHSSRQCLPMLQQNIQTVCPALNHTVILGDLNHAAMNGVQGVVIDW